jgi:hypothetical protein
MYAKNCFKYYKGRRFNDKYIIGPIKKFVAGMYHKFSPATTPN